MTLQHRSTCTDLGRTLRRALRHPRLGWFGITVALLSLPALTAAAQSVGAPEVTPKVIEANTPTMVTVTAMIPNQTPAVIPSSVLLQQVDQNGTVLKVLGFMSLLPAPNPLLAPNTNVFQIANVPVTLALGQQTFFRVSAGFKGQLRRVSCGQGDLGVFNASVSAVGAFIADFSPEGIQQFLTDEPTVRSASSFLNRLSPQDFKQYWIMMSDSDSSQTGDAIHPRLLVPSQDSSMVFGFALDSNSLEYIQFDTTLNRFRFHSIDAQAGKVTPDDPTCSSCHSGPAKGETWPYPRPNWDAYDSWGGALPYNRDRIYMNSVEETAVQRLLKALWNDPIVGQLDLPTGITRACNGDVTITPDNMDPMAGMAGTFDVLYEEDAQGNVTYPGAAPPATGDVVVAQGGPYLTMHTTAKPPLPAGPNDEGRGVALFDQFTTLNVKRVAQELLDKPRSMTGLDFPTAVDIRPIALAIANNCVDATNLADFAPPAALQAFETFHGMNFDDLLADTLERMHSLPQLKANQEAENVGGVNDMGGLINANGGANGSATPNPTSITQQVARRSKESYTLDTITPFMIDRELYGQYTEQIALFRFFLEPSQEPVNKWTMSINGASLDHSITYTFGDLFPQYITGIVTALGNVELSDHFGSDPALGSEKSCTQLAADSYDWFDAVITNNPGYFE